MVSKVVHSSKKTGGSDNWGTPVDVFNQLNERWKFDIDVAADESNHLCPIWYGPGGLYDDALSAPWGPKKIHGLETATHVYCNPPYSRVGEFVAKASEEASVNNATTVMLIPARTDTRWFHEYVYDTLAQGWRPHIHVVFIKGRLKFILPHPAEITDVIAPTNSAPFPSMLVFFYAHNASRPQV